MADAEFSIDRRRAKAREKKLRYRARHPERVRAQDAESFRKRKTENPLKYAFWAQKGGAGQRGIKWLLTFEEWWGIWQASGKWGQRGRKKGQFVMARFGDQGAYMADNVAIVPNAVNNAERGRRLLTGSKWTIRDGKRVYTFVES